MFCEVSLPWCVNEPVGKLIPESTIRSEQYTFIVGEDKVSIVVHAAALAATSAQMDRLINGDMKEAKNKCAGMPDISVEDFTRFCEYAYRGDYAAPMYTVDEGQQAGKKIEDTSDPISSTAQDGEAATQIDNDLATPQYHDAPPVDDGRAGFEAKKGKKPKPSKRSIFRANFQRRTYLSQNEYRLETIEQFKPKSNTSAEQNYTLVFLAHARLYAFAHLRLIDNLKRLTLEKCTRHYLAFNSSRNVSMTSCSWLVMRIQMSTFPTELPTDASTSSES